MPSLKDIRKRIASVKNTQKITKAMKMVAAAKLRRAQDAIGSARPYAIKLDDVVRVLANAVDKDAHPLLRTPEHKGVARVMVVTSDRGLCGGFNSNTLRRLEQFYQEFSSEYDRIELVVVGRKGNDYFRRRSHTVVSTHTQVLGAPSPYTHAKKMALTIIDDFTRGEIDHFFICFSEFKSAIAQTPRIHRVLPIATETAEGEAAEHGEFIFEPGKNELLEVLLPRFVEVQIHRALLDATASEQGARMTAMDNASGNASDLINSLTLKYNRARQASITKELMEITGGAEALKG